MKKNKGITLIALVITIIVLLILAGIFLSLILGENGILKQAQNGVTETRNAEEKEKIKMAVAAAQAVGHGVLSKENLDIELDKVFNNGKEVKKVSFGRLPAKYQEVEYIGSTGTQYINTEIVPDLNIGLYISILDFEKKSWNVLLGSVTAYQINSRYRISTEEEKSYAFLGDKIKIEIPEFDNIQIDFNNPIGKLRFNGLEYNITNTSFSSSNLPITLFAENNSHNGICSFSTAKIKEIKFYKNNSVFRDYIPCYTKTAVTDVNNDQCSSGTVGMYDIVEGKFYTNQGTGKFNHGDIATSDVQGWNYEIDDNRKYNINNDGKVEEY